MRDGLSAPYVEPRNDLERALAAMWREGLGVARVGVHDDFIELGGYSLLAIGIVLQIRQLLTVDFSVQDFLQRPTIASQAEAIAQTLAAFASEQILADHSALSDSEPGG